MKKNNLDLNGLLLIRKERGMNSTLAGAVMKRLLRPLGRAHIGHLGTLDPLAEGLLPLMFGKSARLCEHLLAKPKTYVFDVDFGYSTPTLDLGSEVSERRPIVPFTRDAVLAAVAQMRGAQVQTPPMYSAVKVAGARLYDLARADAAIDLDALKRKIEIYAFDLLALRPDGVSLQVTCSKGTYVRVLAQDLAHKLGNIATVTGILRTACAGFQVKDAHSLGAVEAHLNAGGSVEDLLIPLNKIPLDFPVYRCPDARTQQRLHFGQFVRISLDAFPLSTDEVLLADPHANPFAIGKLSPRVDYSELKLHRLLV